MKTKSNNNKRETRKISRKDNIKGLSKEVFIDTNDYIHGRFSLWDPNNVYIGTYYSSNANHFLVNTYKRLIKT